MRASRATLGSALFFAAAPGVVAGAVPWLLTGWRPQHPLVWAIPARVVGIILVVAGGVVLVWSFARFVTEGLGTPAPIAPTERLVIGGLYRHVRNPMYLAVIATIAGQDLILQRPVLGWYLAVITVAVVTFVHIYEQPVLRQRFGERYEQYTHSVRGWLPRLRPYRPSDRPSYQ